MSPLKLILWFFVFAIPLYTVLMVLPWSGLERGYARVFWAMNEWCLGDIGKDGFVRFGALHNSRPGLVPQGMDKYVDQLRRIKDDRDTLVILGSRGALGHFGAARTSSRLVGYYPVAFMLVLCLSAPIAWKRRLLLVVFGLTLVHLFVLFRVYLWLVFLFSAVPGAKRAKYIQYELSPEWYKRLDAVKEVFHSDPTVSYVLPIAICVLVLFAMGELRPAFRAIGGARSNDVEPPSTKSPDGT